MEDFARYAIYHLPAPGPLSDLASRWLGWSAETGREPAPLDVANLPRPRAELTETPRRYGFHATLKPPFRLAPGSTPGALEADVAHLAGRLGIAEAEGLALSRIGSFLALVPYGNTDALADLAAEVVTGLDRHRAPAPAQERARRRAAGLTPRQEAHLARWGYPYVMDEFRLHYTLTGRLADAEAPAVEAALGPLFEPHLPRPARIEALALCGEDARGRFHLIRRYPLGG